MIMENYIIKLYEQGKSEVSKKKTALRIWLLVLLYVTIGWCCNSILAMVFHSENWFIICSMNVVVLMTVIAIIDYIDERINISRHKDNYERNIDILYDVVSKVVINLNREKIEELINNYQVIIEDKKSKLKYRNKLIYATGTAFGTILSLSFANMDKTGIGFSDWIKVCIVCVLIMVIIMFPLVIYNFIDYQEKEYESIIKDLRNLLFMKF